MELIKPIDEVQRQRVIDETSSCIQQAGGLFRRAFDFIPVSFDLRGRAAGMYRVKKQQRMIRYNPWLFARYFADNLANTVPHEVAHYIIDMVYGYTDGSGAQPGSEGIPPFRLRFRIHRETGATGHAHRIRPHGREWQALMAEFGADASRTCCYDLAGIPLRTQKRHHYYCSCATHRLSTIRHNKIRNRAARYFCRQCRAELILQPSHG